MRLAIHFLFLTHILFGQEAELSNIAFDPAYIDSVILQKYNFKQDNPGLSIMVVKDDELLYRRNIGMANVKKNIPITDSTIFNMGSITKQFTAFCILKLEEEGKINLNDPVQKYIPELPDFGETITLHHLLSHTSGIPDYLEVLGLKNQFTNKRLQTEFMLEFYSTYHTLSFVPGERFSYSNPVYMMLCMVVERVSGTRIQDYANENIFRPLKMHSAKFTAHERDGIHDGTKSYYLLKNKFKAHNPVQPNAMGATGVFCTLDDYRKWDANFSDPTDATKSIVARMKQEYLFKNGMKSGYGAGIILKRYKGYLSEEHSGGWNSFLVQCRRLPALGVSVFVASVSTAHQPFKICDEITDLFLPDQKADELFVTESEHRPFDSDNFSGTYLDANNIIRKVVNRNDTLVISNYSDTQKVIQVLKYVNTTGDSLVQFTDGASDTLQFVKKDNGVKGFYWSGSTYFRFKRFYDKLEPIKSDFSLFAGKYASKGAGYAFRIIRDRKNRVKLKPLFFMQYPLDYLGDNVFKLKNEPIYLRFYEHYVSVGNEWVSNLILQKAK